MLETPEVSQNTLRSPYKSIIIKKIHKGMDEQVARNLTAIQLSRKRNDPFYKLERERRIEAEKNSITDALTGLRNRRYFMGDKEKKDVGELEQEFAEAIRFNHDLTLLMVDIDSFKIINDTKGHEVGDKFLQILADTMRETFRHGDILVRYGGEEFCVLLPETDTDNMKKLVKRFHQKFRELQVKSRILEQNGILTAKTISIGVTSLKDDQGNLRYGKDDDKKHELFLDEADKAMYAAKNLGKNRTVLFNSAEYNDYVQKEKNK